MKVLALIMIIYITVFYIHADDKGTSTTKGHLHNIRLHTHARTHARTHAHTHTCFMHPKVKAGFNLLTPKVRKAYLP